MKSVYKLSLVAVAASLVLVNCGGGDDDDTFVSADFTGQFVDTYVKGLNYTCTLDGEVTGSGVTNDKGEFTCNEGNLVEFSIGNYVIGSDHAWDNPIKSPYDLSLGSMEAITNLAQLLQTLDSPADGLITIPENYAGLNDVNIKLDDPDFDALMAAALNVSSLVLGEVAQAHLDETIASLAPAPVPADTVALESFVSGKNITFSASEGSMTATFASDGYYEENSDTHFCNGSWTLLSSTTIQTTCADEGVTATPADVSTFDFIGELTTGMTVIHSEMGSVIITNIATAVNPDA